MVLFCFAVMPLSDTMYCAQQIHIPPELPDILKSFTKAAIRTQPKDVCLWSAAYVLFSHSSVVADIYNCVLF